MPSDVDSVDTFTTEFLKRLQFGQGVVLARATTNDLYFALARTVRQQLMSRWLETLNVQRKAKAKAVVYLSAEYLLGRQLDNNLLASGLTEIAEQSMERLGIDITTLREAELEPGLGNGGLGRLAACFIDSLATMQIPAVGYGIRYEYGIFRQTFVDGVQVEQPDSWLTNGSPWEFPHPEMGVKVRFAGHTETEHRDDGSVATTWVHGWEVIGIPYNYMVPGYRTENVNALRLWSARATQAFDLQVFNSGDYLQAVRAQAFAENISKVLYPEDSTPQGKELRLQQQYFFVACSLRDYLDNVLPADFDLRRLPERVVFQLNDTHPVIAIPELIRILVDERGIAWDVALDIARQVFNYTCHTLLPEALEVWSVELLGRLLPRHLEIIYRLNDEFLADLREAYPGDELRVRRMSIIQEHPERAVRMAYLATVVGTKVNGVAELHSQLLRDKVLTDFSAHWPEKFTNVTNGVTPRRFVRLANPGLSGLITETIGEGWLKDLAELQQLEPYADDASFLERFAAIKSANKSRLSELVERRQGIVLPQAALYDVMVKRLHEYKRQTLKLLHVITLYQRIQENPDLDIVPRVVLFGAKAAPGYRIAKDTIALINAVATTIDADPAVKGRLKVAFPANYNVSLAEILIPAADLSEQISLAGKEASGTGNMKLALNGALTIGTLDGANVEILEQVGAENFFLFGLTEPEAQAIQTAGYQPHEHYASSPGLRKALDAVASGEFSGGDTEAFAPLVDSLLYQDRFLALADYDAYVAAQDEVEVAYRDTKAWTRSAVLNTARSGYFSSDRSIQDYLDRIWHAKPVPVAGPTG
ncbi:glycogen/starch/alpha-glucan phosphorylase [Nakamurella flavida]|uniref:Alpha-1,4 glucan phosphorylase n=1 Tax=Nakamurella flavida TaxID=363630 RepID=A0A938YMK7_9ACTN|nr:glycogen/starch/alpha-glucan phosphorylase [Nakamurella flavida]